MNINHSVDIEPDRSVFAVYKGNNHTLSEHIIRKWFSHYVKVLSWWLIDNLEDCAAEDCEEKKQRKTWTENILVRILTEQKVQVDKNMSESRREELLNYTFTGHSTSWDSNMCAWGTLSSTPALKWDGIKIKGGKGRKSMVSLEHF